MSAEFFVENTIAYTRFKGAKGTLNYYDVNALMEHAKQLETGSKYVEVGSYLGCSALIVASFSNALVYAHDIWVSDWSELKGDPPPEVKDYFYEFYANVKKNEYEQRIIPIRGQSGYTLGIHDAESIDLAFIDGDHSYEGCLLDLKTVFPKVKHGGVILVHDCYPNSATLRAVDAFTKEYDVLPMTCGMVRIRKI